VGEEGIDLQEQARYVLHYDLEWNPAKMEQREGRVDREGYRFSTPIDVRFFLLKGTYEERIFHTVMQRDQWFQILMGDSKKGMGAFKEDEKDDDKRDTELFSEVQAESQGSFGAITKQEIEAIALDLTPLREHESVSHES
jgi:SNF2 family DNA or RNA helicase